MFGSGTASTSAVASIVAELTCTRQPPVSVTAVLSGYGFSRLPGGTNVTATIRQPLSRKEHLAREPVHAPVHFVSFQPLAAEALTTIRRPFGTWNVWTHGYWRQANDWPPVTRTVPSPVTLTFNETVPGRLAAEAPPAATDPIRAAPTAPTRATPAISSQLRLATISPPCRLPGTQ